MSSSSTMDLLFLVWRSHLTVESSSEFQTTPKDFLFHLTKHFVNLKKEEKFEWVHRFFFIRITQLKPKPSDS